MRSLWKCNFSFPKISKKFRKTVSPTLVRAKGIKPIFYIWKRSALISKFYLHKRVGIHTGRLYHSIMIHRFMIGRRFGEFAVTKRLGSFIHIKQSKKRRKK